MSEPAEDDGRGVEVECAEGDHDTSEEREQVLSEVNARDAVALAEASDVSLPEGADVGELVHILDAARREERLLHTGEEDALGMLPPATGCGLLIDGEDRFVAIATTRDLIVNMLRVQSFGDPLSAKDPLMKIATRANQVYALRTGDTVNYLLHYMIPSGEGFRHVPLLDSDGRPIGVFLLKYVLDYSLRFLENGDQTSLLQLGLRDLSGRVVKRTATIADALQCMNEYRRRCIFVVESVEEPAFNAIGILSEWDLINAVLVKNMKLDTPVSRIMSETIESCDIEESVLDASKKMLALNHHQLMVTCNGHLVGIVSLRKILDHIADFFPSEVRCIPPQAQRFCTREGA